MTGIYDPQRFRFGIAKNYFGKLATLRRSIYWTNPQPSETMSDSDNTRPGSTKQLVALAQMHD